MATEKKLKINFVAHLHPFFYSGGGEQCTRKIVEFGRELGHDIRIIAMSPKKQRWVSRLKAHRDPDLWVLFDVFNVPEARKHFSRKFIDKIITSGRYVIGQNGYGDICYLNALPCNGNIGDGVQCVEKRDVYFNHRGNTKGWQDGYCPVNDNRKLFANACLNIFVSPLHADVFEKIYPEISDKSFVLKPLIDLDQFYNMNLERDIEYAAYGAMSEAKGFYNIRDAFPDEEVVFFGSDESYLSGKHQYGKCIGRLPYDEMPAFLNRVKTLIVMPRWPEPNGLIVSQAIMCGCKVISNDKVGALTHDFDLNDKEQYRGGASELWSKMEAMAGGL